MLESVGIEVDPEGEPFRERRAGGAPGLAPGILMQGTPPGSDAPRVADHEVLSRIGAGSYGSIWLARSVLGTYRALKVVQRETFKSERHYEREFEGVRHFEPISRSHSGFVQILHVGRNDKAGYFYYLMELADDLTAGQRIEPGRYRPRTLRSDLDRRRRLGLEECAMLAQPLLAALQELHRRGLVHRDVKPANFIFVEGVPKLADIGLVATAREAGTLVGSLGYNPPEGSGQPSGDLFSFGRVLYEMFSGVDVQALADELPDLTPRLKDDREREFYRLIQWACQADPRRRPESAAVFSQALSGLLGRGMTGTDAVVKPEPSATTGGAGGESPGVGPAKVELGTTVGGPGRRSPSETAIYVARAADATLVSAFEQGEGMVLVTGSGQMGKTSLLVRGLRKARAYGVRVAFTDLHKVNDESLTSLDRLYHALGESLADQLEVARLPREVWDSGRAANANLDRYLRKHVLAAVDARVIWALDEVDRLFRCPFHNEFFGLLRAWYNERAVEMDGPLSRLTIAVTYSTDVQLFITDLNQSPFNVGTRIELEDFTREEVGQLNAQYGSPLRDAAELATFYRLLNGHPYLSRLGLRWLAREGGTLEALMAEAGTDRGVFAQPLQRLAAVIRGDATLVAAVRRLLGGGAAFDLRTFDRLRSAGVVAGGAASAPELRCELYGRYLRAHLDD